MMTKLNKLPKWMVIVGTVGFSLLLLYGLVQIKTVHIPIGSVVIDESYKVHTRPYLSNQQFMEVELQSQVYAKQYVVYTKDKIPVSMELSVIYKPDSDNIPRYIKTVSDDTVLVNAIISINLNKNFADISYAELYNNPKDFTYGILELVESNTKTEFKEYGIEVQKVGLSTLTFNREDIDKIPPSPEEVSTIKKGSGNPQPT